MMLVLGNASDSVNEDVQLSAADADHHHSNHILHVGQRKHQMAFTELGNSCEEEFPILLITQDGGLWLIVMILLLCSLKDPSSHRLSIKSFQSFVHLIHICCTVLPPKLSPGLVTNCQKTKEIFSFALSIYAI